MNNSCLKITVLLGIPLLPLCAAWGQAPPPLLPGMPIRGGNIVVKVAAFDDARRQALGAAASQGAELLAARTLVDAKGRKHGWLEFRLPAARLPALLGAVSGSGKLYGESVATADHASEYEELARRIVRLQQHEVRLGGWNCSSQAACRQGSHAGMAPPGSTIKSSDWHRRVWADNLPMRRANLLTA